jgi:predicted O-linked N-acetylglucosamine transferase (SPINDLY family)
VNGSIERDAEFHRGCERLNAGDFTAAIACLRRLAETYPKDAPVLEKLATAYQCDGQYLPALKAYDRIIELGAATDATWRLTGNALTDVGEYAQAIGAYQHSLRLNATEPETHHNLARVMYRLGDVDRAVSHLEAATAHCTDIDPWLSLATILPGAPAATQAAILETRRAFASKLAEWLNAQPAGRPRRSSQSSAIPLRIAYLSAFFHSPNYMKPVWGLLNHHDRSRFQVHLFSDSPPAAGTPGYKAHRQDVVHQVSGLDTEDLGKLIRSEGIELLVDLNAYSTAHRLPLFLERHAPVTLAWFNMYATSGMPGIDYIVGDGEVVYPEEESFYSEQIRRLPLSYLTFEVSHPTPPAAKAPPASATPFTFGSLVAQYKITPPVVDAWSRILQRTNGTRLLLANTALKSPHNRQYVLDRFAERGVEADRLILEGPCAHLEYLQKYDRIDLALDAFPYNGGTTTMEALWQGVPVLALRGDRWAGRTSQSLIRRSHLGQFVADDVEAYVTQATNVASDPNAVTWLAEVRSTMRMRLEENSICDTRSLATHMERLYMRCLEETNPRGSV